MLFYLKFIKKETGITKTGPLRLQIHRIIFILSFQKNLYSFYIDARHLNINQFRLPATIFRFDFVAIINNSLKFI